MDQGKLPGKSVAVLGYGPGVRGEASRLRAAGYRVSVAVRHGGVSWINATSDGFRPVVPGVAIELADAVLVRVPDRELPALWGQVIEPSLRPGTLVVFSRAIVVQAGIVEPSSRLDVALSVAGDDGEARVAIHQDATGRALERAATLARAVHGADRVGTTTFEAQMDAELEEMARQHGGFEALRARWEQQMQDSGHEPDLAVQAYYERLRDLAPPSARRSGVIESGRRSPARGAA